LREPGQQQRFDAFGTIRHNTITIVLPSW